MHKADLLVAARDPDADMVGPERDNPQMLFANAAHGPSHETRTTIMETR